MLVSCCLRLCGLLLAVLLFPLAAGARAAEPPVLVEGWLSGKEPFDRVRKQSRAKIHEFKLNAGDLFLIELRSEDFNTYLRVEDSDGKLLAENDGIYRGNTKSRVAVTPTKGGQCRVIVASTEGGRFGAYVLQVEKLRLQGAAKETKGALTKEGEVQKGRYATTRLIQWKGGGGLPFEVAQQGFRSRAGGIFPENASDC